ncbi:MAG: hypothetical protein ORN85_02800 [Sediminibacterium sp.]|nr:hypothetical protein [Sediminibacterium sp.]
MVIGWGQNNFGQINIPKRGDSLVQLSPGESHSLGLKLDGTVVAWGDNSLGQSTIPLGLNQVVEISAGGKYSMALRSDGIVVAWGDNSLSQSSIPHGLNQVVEISAGYAHGLALRSDGTVVAWGDTSQGKTTIPLGLSKVVQISAGFYHSLALNSDGMVIAWGSNKFNQSMVPDGLKNILQISAGAAQSLVLLEDKTVESWGFSNKNEPIVPTDLTNVVKIFAGNYFNLALKTNNNVVAWGDTSGGRINIPFILNNNVDDLFTTSNAYHSFASYKLTVHTSSSVGGSISPTTFVKRGDKVKITYSPTTGFVIDSIYINGLYDSAVTHDSLTSYTFVNVREQSVIKVVYKIQTFTIAASVSIGGSINPLGNNIVNYGARPTFTITTNEGYLLDSVLINGRKVDSINSYTFDSVKMNQTIRIIFKIRTFIINSAAAINRSINPVGTDTVNYGTRPKYTITPQIGYVVDSLLVNGVKIDSFNSYTFDSIKMNQTIRATFKIQTFTITASAGVGGSINPTGNNIINFDSSILFSINANDTLIIDSVFINSSLFYGFTNGTQAGITQLSYRFSNVRGDSSIKVVFRKIVASNSPVNIVATGRNGMVLLVFLHLY